MQDWQHAGFGLYIHWPFCESKCPYCDFNSHVATQIDQLKWAAAYVAEIDRIHAQTPDRVLNTVFFGGGTPSLMTPNLVARILEHVRSKWRQANDVEITLEANPGSVDMERFRGYADAGVNRISMGIQALNDSDLSRLGRRHNTAEALAAFDVARTLFDRVSFDLIYARQDQTLQDWKSELELALSFAVDHLSLYQLTVEQGTAFADRLARGGLRGLPDENLAADMFDLTQDITADHGLPAYEISNHARSGAESRHNLIYWRMGDYAGIGPGAHGRLTLGSDRVATESYKAPGKWLDQVQKLGCGESVREVLSGQDCATELALMSLRLSEGLDLERYSALSGGHISEKKILSLVQSGHVQHTGNRLIATSTGRIVLNEVLRTLLAD